MRKPYPDASIEFTVTDRLRDRLEPKWRTDDNARRMLEDGLSKLQLLADKAYLQWRRHNPNRGGTFEIKVGETDTLTCDGYDACHLPDPDVVVLADDWIERNYGQDGRSFEEAMQNLFLVLTHEAGHHFGYQNSGGTAVGCAGSDDLCHAPVGSGSVMSYDHLLDGGTVRYNVDSDDIRHIPGATWNGKEKDRHAVWQVGKGIPSIRRWGVWIDHEFMVSGTTDPGESWGGNFSVRDRITGEGFVLGDRSDELPPTRATYSGKDNFLGVDLNPDYLGALLQADANLEYTFSGDPTLELDVNEFEAYYRKDDGNPEWHDHNFSNWGDFQYMMACKPGGCSSEDVKARWYPDDDGDRTGWVGGEVDDNTNNYAGSFVAEKD